MTTVPAPDGVTVGRARDGDGGCLSIVATPIGSLDDVTLRALETLRTADHVLAEDTRQTRKLFDRHGIGTKLAPFHAHSAPEVVARWIDALHGGAHLALVSDAGTPLISDPGARLVEAAHDAGIRVVAVPGPSAVLAALAVAGLPTDEFRFVGFLPRMGGRRARAIERVARDPATTVLFESPHRVGATLAELAAAAGEGRRAAVCRELTKLHEEVCRGSLAELAQRFADGARGEITLVIEGQRAPVVATAPEPDEVAAFLDDIEEPVRGAKERARLVAAHFGLSTKDAYALVLRADALATDALATDALATEPDRD